MRNFGDPRPQQGEPSSEDLLWEAREQENIRKEKEMEKSIIVASPFELMDRLDDQQIVDSIKGKVIEEFVYSFTDKTTGKVIEGLSKTGVDESCKQLANKGEVIRELECDMEAQDEAYACFKAKAGRYAVNADGKEILLETKIGHKRQCKYMIGKGNVPDRTRPNPFWYEQGGQKALRNCRRDLLSENFLIELIKKWKEQGKVKKIEENIENGIITKPQGDLSEVLSFGKYRNKSFIEAHKINSSYFPWLLNESDMFKNNKNKELKEKIELFLDNQRLQQDFNAELQEDLSEEETEQ